MRGLGEGSRRSRAWGLTAALKVCCSCTRMPEQHKVGLLLFQPWHRLCGIYTRIISRPPNRVAARGGNACRCATLPNTGKAEQSIVRLLEKAAAGPYGHNAIGGQARARRLVISQPRVRRIESAARQNLISGE